MKKFLILSLILAGPLWAQTPQDEQLKKVGFTQKLGKNLPLEAVFFDEHGQKVKLGDYFSDKPVIITPVYYQCPMLCTIVLNEFLKSMQELQFTAGKEFDIVTFSIDPEEKASLALAKKQAYLNQYKRAGAEEGWHFLTAGEDAIAQLTETMGFSYFYDPSTDEYAHAAGIVIATADGKIARYFTGIDFNPKDMRLSLVEASENKIGNAIDTIMLLCFHYNPLTGKYSLAIKNVVRLGGIVTVLALAAFIIAMFRKERLRDAHTF